MSKYKYDIENRLINFSVNVILVSGNLNGSFASQHLAKQLIRSTTSAALNYGEAQSAESPRDFLHKMRLCLKELRESLVNLKIQKGAELIENFKKLDELLEENNQLIAIFVTSIRTSEQKNK
ncbi:hypothetical protein P700755_000800 [Psychroflexus torquis ATCC 700755]|uniref:Four helix bundle protein n=1 Tax=Psychroflexus torquis (strain ATCC 700755 / CIP 106069 / ACAM 623) TaxID=313595 RepID=K4IQN0_PSYTT|nr:four helix bundle protein [Psychroflexus torquis]AFU67795.1 hypothetical protein P700755_000800 [Psychroflexus torquis ATCC 700755]